MDAKSDGGVGAGQIANEILLKPISRAGWSWIMKEFVTSNSEWKAFYSPDALCRLRETPGWIESKQDHS